MEKHGYSKDSKVISDLGIGVDCDGIQLTVHSNDRFVNADHVISVLKRVINRWESQKDIIQNCLDEKEIKLEATINNHFVEQSLKIMN